MIKNIKKNKKAQIFLMSALLLASASALGLALIGVYFRDLRLLYETSESVRAIFAADSAIEWRLYEWLHEDGSLAPVMSNNTSFDFQESEREIKATGISNDVRRGIIISGSLLQF